MDLADLDLSLLLTFDALLKERNITRSAARLGMSQPALSARLTRLRTVFRDPLFVAASTGRGVVATPKAIALEAGLAAVLMQLHRLVNEPEMFDPSSTDRTFVIAIYENPALMIVPELVSRIISSAPAARFAFIAPPSDVHRLVERGAVDILIAGSDKANLELMRRPLFDDEFRTAQRRGHPRGVRSLDVDEFCALDHVLISQDGGGFNGMVDAALASIGRKRQVRVSVQSYALAPFVIASSDCICTVPSRIFAKFERELDLFPPPVELAPIELIALWHRRSQVDPGHAWLRERIYDVTSTVLRGNVNSLP